MDQVHLIVIPEIVSNLQPASPPKERQLVHRPGGREPFINCLGGTSAATSTGQNRCMTVDCAQWVKSESQNLMGSEMEAPSFAKHAKDGQTPEAEANERLEEDGASSIDPQVSPASLLFATSRALFLDPFSAWKCCCHLRSLPKRWLHQRPLPRETVR